MAKKHLAIVCGIYYPQPSPTGLCAKRFAQLLGEEYDIEIVCIAEDGVSKTVTQTGDESVCAIHLVGTAKKRVAKKGRLIGTAVRIFDGIQMKTKILGSLSWFRRGAYRELERIHKTKPLDAVFTVCSPMAAHLAGVDMKKKHPALRHVGYTVDPYSSPNRIRPLFVSLARFRRFEKNTLRALDTVLLSEEVMQNRKDLSENLARCEVLPYMLPVLKRTGNGEEHDTTEEIHCVYAGRFYKDIRNPKYMLDVFSRLDGQGITLDLFSVGCEDIVRPYLEMYHNIVLHKQVANDAMGDVYAKADVLVGVGNATAEFFPSKTFEYIVTGKPIVYFNHEDMNNEVLGPYPLSLQCRDTDDIDKTAEAVALFCQEKGGTFVKEAEIAEIYRKNSHENIRQILLGALEA